MEIIDICNTVHLNCPRCKGLWIQKNSVRCANHIDSFDPHYCIQAVGFSIYLPEGTHLLNLLLKDKDAIYLINWWCDHCRVDKKVNGEWLYGYDEGVYLPVLPYDITLQKLKTLLTFS